jgi:hypothetical protein
MDAALGARGSALAIVGRVRSIFPHREGFEPHWPCFQKDPGAAKPATALIVANRTAGKMKEGIAATAPNRGSLFGEAMEAGHDMTVQNGWETCRDA